MTYRELNQLYYIRREIAHYERKLEEIRRRAVSSTTALSQETSGPHPGVSDKVGASVALIVDLEREMRTRTQLLVEVMQQTLAYIDGIEDARTRMILKLRFVDNMRWDDVARELGGYWTGESVRQVFSRWARANLEAEKTDCHGSASQ